MSKAKKIVITVIAVLLFLAAAACFFVPRIMLYAGSKAILSNIGEAATYFTEYDVRNEDVQTIDNGHIAIDIPKEFVKTETSVDSVVIYHNTDKSISVVLMSPEDLSDLNLMLEGTMEETMSSGNVSISTKQLRKGFEAMGNGIPDSAYNTYKCCYLTSKEDNSFWNFNQAAAFLVAGTLKSTVAEYGPVQIYETDTICGFISTGLLEVYSTDDLNTVTGILVKGMDSNDVYAIMNSARACE